MKKITVCSLLLIAFSTAVECVAQNTFPSSGNVGIGTTSPAQPLDVRGNISFGADGYIVGNGYDSYFGSGAALVSGAAASDTAILGATNIVFGTDAGIGNYERLRITTAGNVGIGTTNPTYLLSVNGTIQAKEVLVQSGWSDYIFSPDYHLSSLSEVETFIRAEHHLPGVPSEKQVSDKGVSLGEMQSTLLAQIEQLTLHQIDLEKRLNEQSALLRAQTAQIKALSGENASSRRAPPSSQ